MEPHRVQQDACGRIKAAFATALTTKCRESCWVVPGIPTVSAFWRNVQTGASLLPGQLPGHSVRLGASKVRETVVQYGDGRG